MVEKQKKENDGIKRKEREMAKKLDDAEKKWQNLTEIVIEDLKAKAASEEEPYILHEIETVTGPKKIAEFVIVKMEENARLSQVESTS